jgi:hypothetical protein
MQETCIESKQITIYLTDVVDGWVAWDGYTWDENSGAVLDKDRDIAISRFKEGLVQRKNLQELATIEFTIVED